MDQKYPIENFINKSIIISEDQFISPNFISVSQKHSPFIEKIIVTEGYIKDRIENLAKKIAKDYENENVVFLSILKGASVFATHLSHKLYEVVKYDETNKIKFYFEYFQMSSYVNTQTTGNVNFSTDLQVLERLRNKHVIIVEDINDSGTSMDRLLKLLKENYELKSLKICFLFQKMNPKNVKMNFEVNYLGFLVPDVFLIGFGIDYNEEFRDLNHLCMINQNGVETFRKQ